MYPYYVVTGIPLVDSLFARPDQLQDEYTLDYVLVLAIIGFGIAFVGGYNAAR